MKYEKHRKLQNSACLRVPIELIRPIIELIPDRHTLFALLQTSTVFHIEVTRVIYHTMTDGDRKVLMGFLKTVRNNQSYAALVHTYHAPVELELSREDSLWQRLSSALRHMHNLKELILQDFSYSFHTSNGSSTFPFLLEHFQCQVSTTHDLNRVRHFLARQSQLRSIKIDMRHDNPSRIEPFSSDITQNLTHLCGPLEAMKTFLPGRKITMLTWETERTNFRPRFLAEIITLAPNFAHLEYLTFGPPNWLVSYHESLMAIAPYFTSLQYLELIRYRKDDIDAIRAIPTLKGVSISMGRRNYIDLDLPSSIVEDIFQASPRLTFVAMEEFSCNQGKRVFKSWAKPKTEPSVYTINWSKDTFCHLFELFNPGLQ